MLLRTPWITATVGAAAGVAWGLRGAASGAAERRRQLFESGCDGAVGPRSEDPPRGPLGVAAQTLSSLVGAAVAAALAATGPTPAHCVDARDRWLGRRPASQLSSPAFSHRFQPYRLGEVVNLTAETALFRFLLPSPDDEFRLEPCSTLQALHKGGVNVSECVQRCYTPISPNGTRGYFDMVVRKQPKGRMTEHLFSMRVGDPLLFRVVACKMQYRPAVYTHIGMIGAGSGIAPLLQVIRAAAENDRDPTRVTLLYANPTERRILLKGLLDRLAKRSHGKFRVHYLVSRIADGQGAATDDEPFEGAIGHIDVATVRATMPPPSDDTLIMVCGSDKLMNTVCGVPFAVMKPWSSGSSLQPAASHGGNYSNYVGGVLGQLGYDSEHVYRF